MTKNKEEFKKSIKQYRRIGVVDRYTRSSRSGQNKGVSSARSASPFGKQGLNSNIVKSNVLLPPLSRAQNVVNQSESEEDAF